jgi:hypothetical protein
MCIATKAFSNTGLYRAVYFDGPQSDRDHEGEEIPAWVVYVGDHEAEPTGTVYTLHHYQSAELLAHQMASDRRLDLIHAASPA